MTLSEDAINDTVLVIPSRYNDQLEDLKNKLMSKLNWYELVPLLEQVANLVIDALGDGQEEFEHFLQGLDQRLETIQQLVNVLAEYSQSLALYIKEKGIRNIIRLIRNTLSGPWLQGDIEKRILAPCQLRLL